MKTFFYMGYDFTAENWEEAERYVAENWGYCDADGLYEADEEEEEEN